MPSDFRIK